MVHGQHQTARSAPRNSILPSNTSSPCFSVTHNDCIRTAVQTSRPPHSQTQCIYPVTTPIPFSPHPHSSSPPTMHSLHYLLALISLAASAPSLAPRACNTGAPGGVYTCPYNNFRDFTSSGHYMYVCKWWAPGSQDCFSWDGQYLSEMPQAIGPDGGG